MVPLGPTGAGTRAPWLRIATIGFLGAACLVASPPAWGEPPHSASCSTGVVRDDGQVDSGYGFVPSAREGVYLQAFDGSDFDGTHLTRACVCWLKTRGTADIEFDIVLFADERGRPAAQPFAAVPARATEVAKSVKEAGRLVAVDLPWIPIPAGRFYLGARWDPNANPYLFVCNDRSPETPLTAAFFREDRQPVWTHVAEARDPIFEPHRAIMVRAVASSGPVPLRKEASTAPTPAPAP